MFRVEARIKTIKRVGIPWEIPRDSARGWPCPYCWGIMNLSRKPTWDHVIPTSKGGPNDWDNLIVCCHRCNRDKSDRNPAEFLGVLMARRDSRSVSVRQFVEFLTETWSQEEKSAVWQRVTAAFQRELAELKRAADGPVRLNNPTIKRHMSWPTRDEMDATLTEIRDVMQDIGLPNTHWTYVPPFSVRVLIGSLPEMFKFESKIVLRAAILGHQRAKYLARDRAA